MAPLGVITEMVRLLGMLGKLPPDVIPHLVAFTRALVAGDQTAAERAATSASTAQIFRARVNRPPPPKRG